MKKVILTLSTLAILLVSVIATHYYSEQLTNKSLSVANLAAFEAVEATDPVDCFTCFSVWDGCWIFGCTNITTCGGICPTESSDEWSRDGKCGCQVE